jgi:hypothetical protein
MQKKSHGWLCTKMNATSLKTPYIAALYLCGPSSPLKHKRMQSVLVAREIGRLMTWDGNSKNEVNTHFGKVGKIRLAFKYMPSFWLLSNPPTTPPSAPYDQILDDLDDDKDITFAHIQTICARHFGVQRSDTRIHLTAPTPRALHCAHRRSKPRSRTSTSVKEDMNTSSSSATPSNNMAKSPRKFSAAPA